MVKNLAKCLLLTIGFSLINGGCDDNDSNDDDGDSDDAPACADMSGSWRIDAHCVEDFVGNIFQIEQTDCSLVATGQSAVQGWEGTITADNTIYMSGPTGPEYCEGTLTGDSFSADCEDGCHVECTKQ